MLSIFVDGCERGPAVRPARPPSLGLACTHQQTYKQKRTKNGRITTNTNVWTTYYILDNLERGTVALHPELTLALDNV